MQCAQHKMVIIVTIEAAQGCETLRGNAENGFCRRLATAIHGSRANIAITCIQSPLNKKGGICNHANAPITEYEEANLQDAIMLRTPRVNTPSGGLKANHGENRQQDDSESPLTSRG